MRQCKDDPRAITPTCIMSRACHPTVSFSTFQSIFDAASTEYERKTGKELRTHPLAVELDHCNSPDAVLEILQRQADALEEAGMFGQTLMKWLDPIVHVLYTLSETIGEGVSIVSLSGVSHIPIQTHLIYRRSLLQK